MTRSEGVARRLGVSRNTVRKTNEQIGKLCKKIEVLKRQGGTLKLVECPQDQTRLCVNVSDGQQWVPHFIEELVE